MIKMQEIILYGPDTGGSGVTGNTETTVKWEIDPSSGIIFDASYLHPKEKVIKEKNNKPKSPEHLDIDPLTGRMVNTDYLYHPQK
jgi:hypothetical protein